MKTGRKKREMTRRGVSELGAKVLFCGGTAPWAMEGLWRGATWAWMGHGGASERQ